MHVGERKVFQESSYRESWGWKDDCDVVVLFVKGRDFGIFMARMDRGGDVPYSGERRDVRKHKASFAKPSYNALPWTQVTEIRGK